MADMYTKAFIPTALIATVARIDLHVFKMYGLQNAYTRNINKDIMSVMKNNLKTCVLLNKYVNAI